MKRLTVILTTILLVMAGCGEKQQTTDDLITVDVTAKYPKKELILQDFMDVEYIPLETNDDFLCQGAVMVIGKEIMLLRNWNGDGNIFIYDRKGKAVRKINRKGDGGQEYIYNYEVFLDEDKGEIFVNDNSILVYNLYGTFLRELKHIEDASYSDTYNLNEECFIWWNSAFEFNEKAEEMPSFFVTSKQDGSIIKEIEVPFENRKSTVVIWTDEESNMTYSVSPSYSSILPYKDKIILVESSSDTIYSFSPDYSIKPFMTRTPSVQSMDPEVFLLPGALTDRYYFMHLSTKKYDFSTKKGVPGIYLVYDKEDKSIAEVAVQNADYLVEKHVRMTGKTAKSENGEVVMYQRIEAADLIEANEKGELQGRLKEIAADLDEEDNPVLMLLKNKK